MKESADEIVAFIKKYVKEAGKKGVVLGLSGGLDSAVVAVLAKKALGGKKLHCYYLPEFKTIDFDKRHIEKLCKRFDLTYDVRIIDDILREVVRYDSSDSDLVLGNAKARIRMLKLYQYANDLNCLVIGTGNKSEISIGYFTKWGDGAVDFEPIGHLYKTEVFELAKYLDIPNEIIDKPPTAGLWDGQTDEGELGITYVDLDRALKWIDFISNNVSAMTEYMFNKDIQKKEPKYVKKVAELINKAKHKNQLPPTIKQF